MHFNSVKKTKKQDIRFLSSILTPHTIVCFKTKKTPTRSKGVLKKSKKDFNPIKDLVVLKAASF